MKRLKVYALAAMTATTILFTSCLGGNNTFGGPTFGIVQHGEMGLTTVLNTGYGVAGRLYSPELETQLLGASEGECYFFSFSVDKEKQTATQGQFDYLATIQNLVKVPGSIINPIYESNFLELNENSIPLKSISLGNLINSKTGDWIVAGGELDQTFNKLKINYSLHYSMDSVASDGEIDRVYTLYMLANKDGDLAEGTSQMPYTSFNFTSFFSQAETIEKNSSSAAQKAVYFKIKYVKSIDKDDKTKFELASTQTVGVAVYDTQN